VFHDANNTEQHLGLQVKLPDKASGEHIPAKEIMKKDDKKQWAS